MKIIKKNQLAILVIALMLITAGYLNYDTTYNKDLGMDASTGVAENTSVDLAALGDAELVNTGVTEEQVNTEVTNTEAETQNTSQEVSNEVKTEDTQKIKNSSSDDYFTTSKLERNIMYSQMISRYQEIITSNSQATEQKAIAQEEINKINDLQNAIMIAENLLTSKGFSQNIIFVNGDSISIIIGKEELGADEIAQIQNIVSRELVADLENIHISLK